VSSKRAFALRHGYLRLTRNRGEMAAGACISPAHIGYRRHRPFRALLPPCQSECRRAAAESAACGNSAALRRVRDNASDRPRRAASRHHPSWRKLLTASASCLPMVFSVRANDRKGCLSGKIGAISPRLSSISRPKSMPGGKMRSPRALLISAHTSRARSSGVKKINLRPNF
jgi:hypothetical protein